MPVLVSQRGARARGLAAGSVRARAARMLRALGLAEAELSILLCDDRVMRVLNRDHRGRDRSTDVLAFAMREGTPVPNAAGIVLGDIAISLPTAARQARAAGHDLLSEATALLAHGLLHLLGFDHRTSGEERRMRALTDLLVAAAAATDSGRMWTGRGASAAKPAGKARARDRNFR